MLVSNTVKYKNNYPKLSTKFTDINLGANQYSLNE